jgi:D-3-phosphoglycerate dehydrogenase
MYRILISDPLEATGVTMLRESGHEVRELTAEERPLLAEILPQYDALVVRSGTQVTAELLRIGKQLKVVGRAGIGVDNVDVKTATELGILVVNAPTANLLSAAEHTFALLLAVARNVASADADMKSGQWNRKKWVGIELQGKTLGVIGFGRIGRQVARRAQAFDMKILAFDPFLDDELIRRENAGPRDIEALLAESDAVTLHIPKTDETQNILSAKRIAGMKQGAILVNCARGGLMDEAALLSALEEGHLAGAGFDVFAEEPPKNYALAQHRSVVATPHLGAQTREAQVRISTNTAEMVLRALDGSLAITAVNLPFRPAGASGEPFLRLAEKLGHLASSLAKGSLQRVTVELRGIDEELQVPITIAALKGALRRSRGTGVNYVNAEGTARDAGIEVVRSIASEGTAYPNLVTVTLDGDGGCLEVAGTVFHEQETRVVRLHDFQLEFLPKGFLLVVRNRDVPGVVGKLGRVLGNAGINIASIHLSRRSRSQEALAVARIDQAASTEVLDILRQLEEVKTATLVDVQ